jgi:hypothetical protein
LIGCLSQTTNYRAVQRIGVNLRAEDIVFMSVTIQLDLPEALIQQARQMGLLDNQRVSELLADEVRRRSAGQDLKKALDEIRSAPGQPLAIDEVNAEVKAARAERRAREGRR